ncbi:MAG: RluA family pseudouridine synthase [Deltaproteobacteria bacterium]|nr:RluA family pseudouridine synthase [Deltaproteobacteria bacterium]
MKIKIKENEAGLRLDVFLSQKFKDISRSQIQKKLKECIRVNSKKVKPSCVLNKGDEVEISDTFNSLVSIKPEEGKLDKLYEDDDILLINKPAGLLVHPTASQKRDTLAQRLCFHYKNLPTLQGEDRPGIVHRLDRDTSGIMVIAKKEPIQRFFIQGFKERKVEKTYLALVFGIMDEEKGEIVSQLARSKKHRAKIVSQKVGREAITQWKLLEEFEELSLLEIHPQTGRTHQIRTQLTQIGHPIVGDRLYKVYDWKHNIKKPKSKQVIASFERHMLHAWKLLFIHPTTHKRMEFKAPLPEDFKKALSLLESNYDII